MASNNQDGYLSEESDFYGDAKTREELEQRTKSLDVDKWFEERKPSLTQIADENKRKVVACEPKAHLRNPYEGLDHARQLSETVDHFLERLVPSTSMSPTKLPWIRITNPFVDHEKEMSMEDENSNEDPLPLGTNTQHFIAKGTSILQEFEVAVQEIEKNTEGLSASELSEAIEKRRKESKEEIKNAAKEYGVTQGKWTVHAPSDLVDDFWSYVAKATSTNDLGFAAKVAPSRPRDGFNQWKSQSICVYTADFSNVNDVTRVLRKMKELYLWSNRTKTPIYYIPNAFTLLKIVSGNKWKISESLYNSRELIPPAGRKKGVE